MKLKHSLWIAVACLALLAACASPRHSAGSEQLRLQVLDTERAFARTMANRDHAAFASFLAEEAVFFSGEKPLHGKTQVAEWWKRYFDQPAAPFSWEPEQVEVLESGQLALSTGPVRDPQGRLIGTFTSI
ncbi:MAG: nuclear transport factor 2 family protein, partial [Proteobacteria bacterium]|nr:nuclear transport factor 2 family protein [Pseudomonadota bacterium]